ncbi:hypothetical protein [Oscillatoria nigro-viridis]|uniref:hypothetical protein n=1 Tax=Phormidium nigroviride TaxID=482564 RepID=UPI0012375756|nr:hypothetical protein [Oscillatoria nigro-viridis]
MFETSNFIIFYCRLNSCAWQVLCLELLDNRRSGDRAKVSGKAREGILMILALRAAKTGFTFGTIFHSTNNWFRSTQGAPDNYLSL